MYAWRQQILPLLCFRIKAMRRVPETNIFLRNNNCTTALSTARCYLEATDKVLMKKTVLFCQHKCKIIQGNKTLKWKNKLLQDYQLNNYSKLSSKRSKRSLTPCSRSDFPFLTKTVLENIHRNEGRGYYTKLNDTKNSDIPGNELDECGLVSIFGALW